jgi:hypothetical protein
MEGNMSNQNIKQEATRWTDRVMAKNWVNKVVIGSKAGGRIVQIVAPAALCAYLVVKYSDKIVVGLGVAAGVYGFVSLVKLAYNAESASNNRK